MKIWKYYILPDQDSAKKEYQLYAFTNDKKIAEQFEQDRDLKKFIKAEPIHVDKQEYIDFANKNRGEILKYHSFETSRIQKNGVYGTKTITILTTESEYTNSSSDYSEDFLLNGINVESIPHYKIFKSGIIDALKTLEFIPYYKLLSNSPLLTDDEVDDYSAPEITVDEFAILLRCYHYLFK